MVTKRFAFALAAFAGLSVSALAETGEYRRPRWADADHDCRDTRAEVLESLCGVVQWDAKGCRVVAAECKDVYSGSVIATDSPSQAIHIDHVLPASVLWDRGTFATPAEWESAYNDRANLLPVRARTNARKSDRMPDEWCPATRGGRRVAAEMFSATAKRYGIALTAAELEGLEYWQRGECRPGAAVIQ